MFDIHTHILPQVDDGAKSWEIALEMCRMAQADGIRHMVATPHANEHYQYDRDAHEARLAELRTRFDNGMEFSLGCDFHLSYENLLDLQAHPRRYSIGAGRYLLVEFSNFAIPPQVEDAMLHFGDLGLTPVITHPERNPILQEGLARVLDWADRGCVVQITAGALSGRWGERPQQAALLLLRHKAVHVISTDAHDTERRPPVLSTARAVVAELFGEDVAQALVHGNPEAIVRGQPLPYFPKTERKAEKKPAAKP
jgi:protein-tyrosine phosphatase